MPLGGCGLARCDFFLMTEDGAIYLNGSSIQCRFHSMVNVPTALGKYGDFLTQDLIQGIGILGTEMFDKRKPFDLRTMIYRSRHLSLGRRNL